MSQSIFPPGGIDFSKTQLQSYRYPPRSCLVAKVSEFQECATYCIPPLSRSPPFSLPECSTTIMRRDDREPLTWKQYAGREHGGDGYHFGDLTRHVTLPNNELTTETKNENNTVT